MVTVTSVVITQALLGLDGGSRPQDRRDEVITNEPNVILWITRGPSSQEGDRLRLWRRGRGRRERQFAGAHNRRAVSRSPAAVSQERLNKEIRRWTVTTGLQVVFSNATYPDMT